MVRRLSTDCTYLYWSDYT